MKSLNQDKRAPVFWLTGLSGSGKSTLGRLLAEALQKDETSVVFLDGDDVRSFFGNDLGYVRADRVANIRRLAFAVRLLSDQGHPVVVANMAPYIEARDFVRDKLPNYVQIFLKVDVETVVQRDVKGLYAKAASGNMTDMIGVHDAYETPRQPDLILSTGTQSVDESAQQLIDFCRQKLLVT